MPVAVGQHTRPQVDASLLGSVTVLRVLTAAVNRRFPNVANGDGIRACERSGKQNRVGRKRGEQELSG